MEKTENPTVELLKLMQKDCETFEAYLFQICLNAIGDEVNDGYTYASCIRDKFRDIFNCYMKDYSTH